MPSLQEAINTAAAKARKYSDRSLGEQNTKASLIEPVLEALGWDIRDPDEVQREFRPQGKDKPVDYALKIQREPRLLVEAKGLGETLADRRCLAQVLGYASVAGVAWCVLTDGDEYRFYNSTVPIDADEKLLCRVRLTDCAEGEAAKTLGLISRKHLEQNLLDVLWKSHFVDRRVKAAIHELLTSPGKAIVRLLREKAPKLTSKEILESIPRLDVRIESPAPLQQGRGADAPTSKPRTSPKTEQSDRRPREDVKISLADLISAGVIRPPMRIFCRYKGHDLEATVLPDGAVRFMDKTCRTCSAAAEAARESVTGRKMNTNGWNFWRFMDGEGKKKELDVLRRAFLTDHAAAPLQPTLRLAGGAPAVRSA